MRVLARVKSMPTGYAQPLNPRSRHAGAGVGSGASASTSWTARSVAVSAAIGGDDLLEGVDQREHAARAASRVEVTQSLSQVACMTRPSARSRTGAGGADGVAQHADAVTALAEGAGEAELRRHVAGAVPEGHEDRGRAHRRVLP